MHSCNALVHSSTITFLVNACNNLNFKLVVSATKIPSMISFQTDFLCVINDCLSRCVSSRDKANNLHDHLSS